jgi:hypothetical protein
MDFRPNAAEITGIGRGVSFLKDAAPKAAYIRNI